MSILLCAAGCLSLWYFTMKLLRRFSGCEVYYEIKRFCMVLMLIALFIAYLSIFCYWRFL